jgi:hypothetical protein
MIIEEAEPHERDEWPPTGKEIDRLKALWAAAIFQSLRDFYGHNELQNSAERLRVQDEAERWLMEPIDRQLGDQAIQFEALCDFMDLPIKKIRKLLTEEKWETAQKVIKNRIYRKTKRN